MGTYDTKGGAPVSPPDQGRDPTPFEDEVLGALEDMAAARAELDRCKKTLAEAFVRILSEHIAEGRTVDTRNRGTPMFQAKVLRGKHLQNTQYFRVLGRVNIEVNDGAPCLSRWTCKAQCLRSSGVGEPIGGDVDLNGYVFPRIVHGDGNHQSENDEILREVEKFEARAYALSQTAAQG